MESLAKLGFTHLEAAIYVYLLENSPATGYQIAKGIEKSKSNTYQAVESLSARGLLLVGDGSPRMYRAIPYREMLSQLENTFHITCESAARDLRAIQPAAGDLQVYRVSDRSQVFERAQSLIKRCEKRVIVDAFPLILTLISDQLAAAAGRGVEVIAKVYEPIEIEGVTTVCDSHGRRKPDLWQVQWLNVVGDGREHLFACLDADLRNVIQAIWTESPWVADLVHVGLRSEIVVDEILRKVEGTAVEKEILDIIESFSAGGEDDIPDHIEPIQRDSESPGAEA
jgi:predicted transcriptional regulator